jgi:hypothetical protein
MLIVSPRPRRHQLLDRVRGPRERAPVRVAFRLNRDNARGARVRPDAMADFMSVAVWGCFWCRASYLHSQ